MNAKTVAEIPTPCACQAYEIEIWKGEVPEDADPGEYVEYEGTGCTQTTERIFAPGHDAKLKSLLIRAGAAGREVRRDEDGMAVNSSAENVAKKYGFEHQVLAGIRRAQDKVQARAAKKAAVEKARADLKAGKVTPEGAAALKSDNRSKKAKAAAKQAPKAPRSQAEQASEKMKINALPKVKIKLGRWTYEAQIDTRTNAAHFTSANGEQKVAPEGKYKLVEAAA